METLPEAELGREWEWEETPELSLKIVDDAEHAAALFNRYSPQFVATCISEDPSLGCMRRPPLCACHRRSCAPASASASAGGTTAVLHVPRPAMRAPLRAQRVSA